MYDRIVIGYDGSPGGSDALALALVVADPAAAIRVVYAYPTPLARSAAADRFARQNAEDVISGARKTLRNRHGTSFVLDASSSPAETLHRVARRWPADVIVVGCCHAADRGRTGLGRVGARAIDAAPCPVLLAPSGYRREEHTLARIGVGFGRSAESRAALREAARIVGAVGAELDVIEVITTGPERWPSRVSAERTAAALDVAERAVVETIGELGTSVETEVPAGASADILIERSHRLDLLVVGTGDEGPLGRLVDGSVAGRAACPVVVVPHAG
jgi:nucleotide-binding universal stress UspA family protein